jgi:hypothetical protein
MPRHFEEAASIVSEQMVAATVPCGPNPERHLDALQQYLDAGFDGCSSTRSAKTREDSSSSLTRRPDRISPPNPDTLSGRDCPHPLLAAELGLGDRF